MSVYASPTRPITDFEALLRAMSREVGLLRMNERPVNICGDFNAKHASWSKGIHRK